MVHFLPILLTPPKFFTTNQKIVTEMGSQSHLPVFNVLGTYFAIDGAHLGIVSAYFNIDSVYRIRHFYNINSTR